MGGSYGISGGVSVPFAVDLMLSEVGSPSGIISGVMLPGLSSGIVGFCLMITCGCGRLVSQPSSPCGTASVVSFLSRRSFFSFK